MDLNNCAIDALLNVVSDNDKQLVRAVVPNVRDHGLHLCNTYRHTNVTLKILVFRRTDSIYR